MHRLRTNFETQFAAPSFLLPVANTSSSDQTLCERLGPDGERPRKCSANRVGDERWSVANSFVKARPRLGAKPEPARSVLSLARTINGDFRVSRARRADRQHLSRHLLNCCCPPYLAADRSLEKAVGYGPWASDLPHVQAGCCPLHLSLCSLPDLGSASMPWPGQSEFAQERNLRSRISQGQ